MSSPLKLPSEDGFTGPVRDAAPVVLQFAASSGARTRRHKYFRDIRLFALPVAAAIAAQALLYLLVMLRAGRSDWNTMAVVIAYISLVPILSAFVLTAFRRHETPITVAGLLTAVLAAATVAFLSALRVRVSYTGLAWAMPASIFIMAYANVRFHQALADRVAILHFPGAGAVQALLGGDVPVLSRQGADISQVDAVLIDPAEHHSQAWSELLVRCHMAGVEIVPWMQFIEIRLGRVDIDSFDVSHIAYSPSQVLYWRVKRVIDICAVLVMLPIALPLAALSAAYILVKDGRPILFIQNRRGYGGRSFRMYKFRTMHNGTAGGSTVRNDRRIIRGCGFIRRMRLDELPQLYNILRGEMSMIGPRPVAEYVAATSADAEPKFNFRTLVQPGITGWAQVTSGYAATTEEEINKLSYDLYYLKHLSFDLDLLILFKTIRTLLLGSGAR